MGAHYCSICRQTTFSGKKHIFEKNHQSRLRVVLLKFIEKVKEARRTLKKPLVEKFDCTQHKQTFWCYCCQLEVERNVTDGNMTVLHGGLLEHMATPEHKKNTHKFWWENKADPKFRDKVIITEEETERFKTEVAKVLETFVEKEDEFIKQEADLIRAQEKHRQEVLQSLLERDEGLELSNGPNSTNTSAEASVSSQFPPQGSDQQLGGDFVDSMVDVPWTATGQGLTFIGYQDSSNSGNVHTALQSTQSGERIKQDSNRNRLLMTKFATQSSEKVTTTKLTPLPHPFIPNAIEAYISNFMTHTEYHAHHPDTGAVPPWLQDDPLEGTSGAAVQAEIGPSLQEFLKQKEQEKLRKLPPNRVGANFDHSSHTDANWLPSFGRVWNSGRRWQSRHQFRQEEGQKNRQKRKREHGGEGSKKAKSTKQPTNTDI